MYAAHIIRKKEGEERERDKDENEKKLLTLRDVR